MTKRVFFTGVTGFIGGATFAHLLASPTTRGFEYHALLRSKEKAVILETLGVHPVVGSLDDFDLVSGEAEKADVVIHTGDSSDHVEGCKAILEGMRRRVDKPILLHISGTGILKDDSRGEFLSDEIYDDLDPDHYNRLPDNAYHRNIELMVLAASDKIKTHIITPPTVYGIADHILAQKGISNPTSMQVPEFIRMSLQRGQTALMGKGANVWHQVHFSDIASAIATVLEAALGGKTATGREGYYFAETGDYSQYEMAVEVAKVLHAHGIGTATPTRLTEEEIQKYLGGSYYLGTNARCQSNRTRALGWKPTHKPEDFIKSIAPEIEYILKVDAEKNKA